MSGGIEISRAGLMAALAQAESVVEDRPAEARNILHAVRLMLGADEPGLSARRLLGEPQGRARKLMDEISLPGGLGLGTPPEAEAAPQPPSPEPAQAAGGELRARSKSVTPNRGRKGGVWTPERDELLRKLWDEGASAAQAFEQLNALPAETPIASAQAVYNRAFDLKLRRPPEVAAAMLRRAGRLGAERAAQLAAEGVSTLGARPLVWTAERLALAKELWEAGQSADAMLVRLNELPAAAEISGAHVIRTQAAKHRWKRPEAFLEAKRAKYAEQMRRLRGAAPSVPLDVPATPQIAPAPEPEAAPSAVEPTPEPARPASVSARAYIPAQTDDKAEVFEAFDGGMTVRDAAADFGLPLSTLSNWHTEWKLARKATAA